MQRSDPEDYSLRWQAFLIDGFDDWLPAATIAASNMIKATPRDILKAMISDFYFPEGIKQSTDDISAWMEGFAKNSNAIVKDAKTGEVLGRMSELRKRPDGTYERIEPKRAKPDASKFMAKKEAARIKRAREVNQKLTQKRK